MRDAADCSGIMDLIIFVGHLIPGLQENAMCELSYGCVIFQFYPRDKILSEFLNDFRL